jgi:uncharacterized protein DUF6600/FecR-like protein
MDRIKVWPHMIITGVVVALIAGFGVAFWMKHEQTVSAQEQAYAARIQRVDGEVAFSDGLANTKGADANSEWIAATANQPVSVGDRIYTRDNARTSLAFNGRNFARLNPNTSLDVVSLGDRRTQLALREGSAIFDVGYLAPDELFEVATPYGAVDFEQPGIYNLGFDNNGGVLVSVLSGLAQVVGLGGSGQISKGDMLTLVGQAASELVRSRLNGGDAGYMLDDYYRYQYPNVYDGRYSNYDAYLSDPYYFDPYRRNVSYQYVSSVIPGIYDLDYYGDWRNVDGYGYAWSPRVDSGWVPYQQGYWTNDYPYGLTWVSSEPWGYAPYHYGRWANVGNQWYWIPDGVNTTPSYAPALVAFLPLNNTDQIGWLPLAPGEPYAYRYYDANWEPHYLNGSNVVPSQLVNLGIPGAVTVVPVDAFGRAIDPRIVRRVDGGVLTSVRPTLEPLLLTPLRNAALRSAWGRGKIDLPPGIAKKLRETPVFVGTDVREPRFKNDVAKSLRVERISDKDRNQKLKVRDTQGPADRGQEAKHLDQHRKQEDQQRKQETDRVNAEAARGNREAQRQARETAQQLRRQTRAQVQASRAENPVRHMPDRQVRQQPQGQRVGNPAKQQAQREAIRPPAVHARPVNPRPQMQPRPQVVQPRQQAQPHPQMQPRQQVQAPQMKHEARQQSPGAAKQERQQGPPASPGGQGQGGGKGKGKGKP